MLLQHTKDVIVSLAPKHHTSDKAPNSYSELMQYSSDLEQGLSIPVYSGDSDNTIYGSAAINYAFRAWHDRIHIEHKLDFSEQAELSVAEIQYNELIENGVNKNQAFIILCDIVGQVRYYFKYKKYVINQLGFIKAYLSNSELALQLEW